MSLTGKWINSYGSVMDITEKDGKVRGLYSSTTGSTGIYRILGHVGLKDATEERGRSVALTISWRSLEEGEGDQSWNWTSGYSGQFIKEADGDKIYIMHAMNATNEITGLAAVGTYIDKLIFTRYEGESIFKNMSEIIKESVNSIEGKWTERDYPAVQLEISTSGSGVVSGKVTLENEMLNITGFIDVYANSHDLSLQSLSIATAVKNTGQVSILTGNLEFSTGRLNLFEFGSIGTLPNEKYVQTCLKHWSFIQNNM